MIDKIDIQILEILQNDGRTSASDIAKAVKLSVPAVGERIKKLSEKDFIKKHTTILGHKEAGLDLTAYVFIVSEHSDHYDKFVTKANDCKAVMECHSITGGGSHILKIRVKNSQALEDLLYEIQNWPGVSRTQSNVVLSTYKESTDIDLNILYELINEI
ncbi:MAG: AsnC family transcriptional regulator [Candidatus Marinimicrobia bacterium]|nr:AsnC family transcriptional regulator [Candidatus Neomarinimicrobiota bacterium]|tara:strand:- start:1718 stop:2194 length:477 start_codon:yes stop_codon:yes gene_type:complete